MESLSLSLSERMALVPLSFFLPGHGAGPASAADGGGSVVVFKRSILVAFGAASGARGTAATGGL